MKKNFSTLCSPPAILVYRTIKQRSCWCTPVNPAGIELFSYINFHVTENDHVSENDLVAILRFLGGLEQCFYQLHRGTCFGREFRPSPLHSLVIADRISISVPNNSIVNWLVTILTQSTLTKSPKWPIGTKWNDYSLLSLCVIENS